MRFKGDEMIRGCGEVFGKFAARSTIKFQPTKRFARQELKKRKREGMLPQRDLQVVDQIRTRDLTSMRSKKWRVRRTWRCWKVVVQSFVWEVRTTNLLSCSPLQVLKLAELFRFPLGRKISSISFRSPGSLVPIIECVSSGFCSLTMAPVLSC